MSPSKLTPEVWPVADAGPTPADREESVLVFQPADPTEAHYSGSLYIAASGLSGGARGQLASRYAAQKVMNTYYNSTEPDLGLRLREAFDAANADLYAYAQQRPELVKVGVAIIAVAIRGEQLHIAQVGDSRAYLIREAQIQQITRDHTLVQQLLDEGAIQPDEARDHPRRDVLLRTLGTQEAVTIDIFDMRLRPDDALILCSGGLARSLTDDEIAQVVASKAPRNAAEMLVQKVRGQGLKQPLAVIAALLRDGAPPLTADLPYTWDRQPPSFDEQPTLMAPRARLEDQPPAPPGQMPVGTSLPPIDRTSPAAQTQAAARQMPAEPPVPPEATQPAPTYQTPVQPAPPYGAPPQQQAPPPYYPPAPQQPAYPEAQPQYPAYGQPQQPPPPGYVIDPVTGLPPVPQAQAGWGAPQGAPAYTPRVYQAPGQPRMQSQRRGVSIGTFALVGMFTVLLTALMVLFLINPFGWQLPSLGGIAQAPTATATLPPPTPTLPPVTQPLVVEPTVSVTPTAPTAPPGMVLIEGGAFLRGVPDTEIDAITLPCIDEAEDNTICNRDFFSDAQPVEQVTLSPFFIDITEVTNRAYAACVAANVCRPPTNQRAYNDPAFAEHPVVFVTWDQAKTYCEWAGKRLPTEAEWEKAARWDERTQQSYIWPWGNAFEVGRANTLSAGQGGTSPVTAFAQDISPSGVLDMAGNVSEWVQDWYYPSYQGLGTLNPTGPASQPLRDALRVARGGSFLDVAAYARGGHRLSVKVDKTADWLGFRCAASVAGTTPPAATPTPTVQPTEGPTPTAPPTEGPTPTATQTP